MSVSKTPTNNSNVWSTRQLVTMALMCAIGTLLSFLEFPLLPGVTSLIYKKNRTYKFAILGLVLSIIAGILGSIIGNLLLTPTWLGVPFEAVVAMIIPVLIPFNALKGLLNAILTLIIYKSISNIITPKKDQKKGR